MSHEAFRWLGLAAALALGACVDEPGITQVALQPAISDAVHDGDDHFYFLPPMVPAPTYEGEFAAEAQPSVEICIYEAAACSVPLELYTMESGPGSETIRADPDAEHFVVNWNTESLLSNQPIDPDAGQSYRIRVKVGAQLLGYADVQVVQGGKELKNVDTGAYIPLLDGRTLPIRFRIERGFEATGGVSTSGSLYASCAVDVSGDAWCWGLNTGGLLGIGYSDGEVYPTPQRVVGGHSFVSVGVADGHVCGLTVDLAAYCWGWIVTSPTEVSVAPAPVLVAGGHRWATLAVGGGHACGVTTEGEGLCWGRNVYGSLGAGTGANILRPVPEPVLPGLTLRSIEAKHSTTCAVTVAGEGYCWGWNFYGQTGVGTTVANGPHFIPSPTRVPGHTFESISPGWYHTCGMTTEDGPYCWGHNSVGQLGNGQYVSAWPFADPTPQRVLWPTGVLAPVTVAAGGGHSCSLTEEGAAYCWGAADGDGAELGLVDYGLFFLWSPRFPVTGGHVFTALGLGFTDTCGITVGLEAWCWGVNWRGTVGDGTTVPRGTPWMTLDLDPSS